MEIFLESLTEEWHGLLRLAPRILAALVVVIAFYWIGRGLGRGIVHLLARGHLTGTHVSFFRNLTTWLLVLIGVILALNVLGLRTLAAGLLAGGGITAVAIGFAFRGIGENFLAGLFLAFSRPFNVGDLIQSGDLQGVVRGIELRHTHIRTIDARDIFIPSSQIYNDPLVNYTKDGLRRPSFTVGIDYADDSEEARRILFQAVLEVDRILKERQPGVTISALAPDYVELEVFFWIDTFKEGVSLPQVRTEVMEKCRRALVREGFTISSNVTTNLEGASGAPFQVHLSGEPACGPSGVGG
jgi:small conductance mechanosensitive channel